jgi:hypothetical protein
MLRSARSVKANGAAACLDRCNGFDRHQGVVLAEAKLHVRRVRDETTEQYFMNNMAADSEVHDADNRRYQAD